MTQSVAIKDVGCQMRVTQLVNKVAAAKYDPEAAAELIHAATTVWRESKPAVPAALFADMLTNVEARIETGFPGGRVPPKIEQVLRPAPANAGAMLAGLHTAKAEAPHAMPNDLAAQVGLLDLNQAPSTAAAGPAKRAGTVAPVGGKYVPSELAQKLLAHYHANKDDFEPMAKRRARVFVQEQKLGAKDWQETMDALYVVGSIILDQREGKDGFSLKYFNGDEDHKITSQAALLKKMNGNKTKPTKIPAFSDVFQTAMWDYLRDYEDNKGSKTKVEQESIYLICTGADNDSSDAELREVTRELKSLRLPPKQLCVAAVQIGDDEKGAAKLRKLDDPTDENMRDIFDAPVFAEIDSDNIVTTVLDADGDEVERDGIQKLMMGLFNKELD